MGGRGACDPNKFQILFPATSGSSCVQALRPFPTSPSFPFPRGLFPFSAWSPRATPATGCERRECVCVSGCVTLWVFFWGGGVSTPSPPTHPAVPVSSPQFPGSLWSPRVICPWPHPGVQSGLGRKSWNRWPSPTPLLSLSLPLSFPSYNSYSRPGVQWGGIRGGGQD